jgi:hypothetical protein
MTSKTGSLGTWGFTPSKVFWRATEVVLWLSLRGVAGDKKTIFVPKKLIESPLDPFSHILVGENPPILSFALLRVNICDLAVLPRPSDFGLAKM